MAVLVSLATPLFALVGPALARHFQASTTRGKGLLPVVVLVALAQSGCTMLPMAGGMMGSGHQGGRADSQDAPLTAAPGAEPPWITLALSSARELRLSADQEQSLAAIRDAWNAEAARLSKEIQTLERDLRIGRVEAGEKATAVLTTAQREALAAIARSRGRSASSPAEGQAKGRPHTH